MSSVADDREVSRSLEAVDARAAAEDPAHGNEQSPEVRITCLLVLIGFEVETHLDDPVFNLRGEDHFPLETSVRSRLTRKRVHQTGGGSLADRSLERALRRAEKYATAEPIVRAWLAVARAELAAHKGDPMRYLRYVASCVDAFTEAGDVRSACLQRVNIGNAYLQLGGYAQAESVLREALMIAAPMRLRFVASLKANLGFALARLRRAEEAATAESDALEQCVRQGNRRFECISRIYMATVQSLQGDVAAAVTSAHQAFESSGDFPGIRAYAGATY